MDSVVGEKTGGKRERMAGKRENRNNLIWGGAVIEKEKVLNIPPVSQQAY